jgi:signal transduction histidine kinase
MLAQANHVNTAKLSDLTDPRMARVCNHFSQIAAALSVLIGLGALLLWLLAKPYLIAIRPAWIAMMPNSAVAFIALGAALLVLVSRDTGDRWRIPVATACCALAIAIGAASLLEDVTDLNLGIDELMFRDASTVVGMFHPPGRPAPVTSGLLIMLALALLATIPRLGMLNALCSTLALFVAMTLMVAYVLNAREMYTFGNHAIPTSFIAALSLLLLAAGAVCQNPHHVLFRRLASGGAGGLMLRKVLPLVFVMNTVLVALGIWTQSEGLFSTTEFGAAAVASLSSLCIFIIFIGYAKQMDNLEIVRRIAQAQGHQLNVLLKQKLSDLEQVNRELEEFSYSMSHDLRTPLRAIDGFSGILVQDYADKLDPEGKRIIGVVRDGTRKMAQLIDDILAFCRIGRIEMSISKVDMNGLINELLPELTEPMSGRDICLTVRPLPLAQGDQMMLRSVWHNLLDNAIKYTAGRAAARIEIGGTGDDGELVYWIKDNGAGFDMRYADKLFGMFRRLHGEQEFGGTGIGLAIVKRIVTRHGGRVWAVGQPDRGATFYFALPARISANV